MSMHPNLPTTKLLSSLRHSGYNSVTAIQDITDNSFDALATRIDVSMKNELPTESKAKAESSFAICIADNGVGMDEETLLEALKLGSETSHRGGDLGKFGMGLLTASLSIGRQLEILTRKKDGKYLHGIFDYDHIVNTKDWSCFVAEMSASQKKKFERACGKHGTVVTVRNIDKCTYTNISAYSNALVKSVGMAYFDRLGQTQKMKITINGKVVKAVNPLEPTLPDCLRKDELIDIDDDTSINMSVLLIPKQIVTRGKSAEELVDVPITGSSCGLYFVRSGRVIVHKSFKLIGKAPHNTHNRLRCVVRFDDGADELLGIPYNKSEVEPNQSVIDKMKNFLGPYLAQAVDNYKNDIIKEAVDEVSEEVKKAQEKIASTSKFHKFPPKPAGTRKPYGPRDGKTDTKEPKDKRVKVRGRSFRVKYISGGSMGQLIMFGVENGEVVITWNVDHAFYTKFMVDSAVAESGHQRHSTIMEVMQFVAFSLATTALTGATEVLNTVDDEEFAMMSEYIVGQMSDTLRYVAMK